MVKNTQTFTRSVSCEYIKPTICNWNLPYQERGRGGGGGGEGECPKVGLYSQVGSYMPTPG